MNFAKMLKEKVFSTGYYATEGLIKVEHLAEWEWDNGGKQFAKRKFRGIPQKLKTSRYLIGDAKWLLQSVMPRSSEVILEADCFLRAYRLDKVWAETKILEMVK